MFSWRILYKRCITGPKQSPCIRTKTAAGAICRRYAGSIASCLQVAQTHFEEYIPTPATSCRYRQGKRRSRGCTILLRMRQDGKWRPRPRCNRAGLLYCKGTTRALRRDSRHFSGAGAYGRAIARELPNLLARLRLAIQARTSANHRQKHSNCFRDHTCRLAIVPFFQTRVEAHRLLCKSTLP